MHTLRNALVRTCKFAIPLVGATLIAYGAWMVYAPAGFIVGGLLVFVLEHAIDSDGGRG